MNWKRMSSLAIAEVVATIIIAIISISLLNSSYKRYFLQKYLSGALRCYASGPEHFEEAIQFLEKAKKTDLKYGPIYMLEGTILAHPSKNRVQSAKKALELALKYSPSKETKYLANLGLGIVTLARISGNQEKKEKKEAKEKKRKKRRKKRRKRHKKKRKRKLSSFCKEAEVFFEKASSFAEDRQDHVFYQWIVDSIQGKKGPANSKFREIKDIFSEMKEKGNVPLLSTLASFYCERGQEALKNGKFEETVGYLQQAIRIAPRLKFPSYLLSKTLSLLLNRDWKSDNSLEKKSKDIFFVEKILNLNIGKNTYNGKSFLGLDSYRYFLSSELGYSYGRLALLATLKYGWANSLKNLDTPLAKHLKRIQCNTPEEILKHGLKLLKKSRQGYSRNKKKTKTMDNGVSLFYEIRTLELWVEQDPKHAGSRYEHIFKDYQELSRLTFLGTENRRNIFNNLALYRSKVGYPLASIDFTKKAISLIKSDPRPYINLAVFLENSPHDYIKKKAVIYYEKALQLFEKNLSEGVKYSPEFMELKSKVEIRKNTLKDK